MQDHVCDLVNMKLDHIAAVHTIRSQQPEPKSLDPKLLNTKLLNSNTTITPKLLLVVLRG